MLVSRSGNEIVFSVDQKKVQEILKLKEEWGDGFPRFGILVLSYNAKEFIEKTIQRIPIELESVISEIFVFDDNSPDNTYEIAEQLKEVSSWKHKLNVFKNPRNLRYGGNQKIGYSYAIERGIDFVIMLHGDGQYAPEYIPDLILPAVKDKKEVVFASRMINKKDALRGGMPLYKFIGNQVLTRFENLILGTKLFEFHSGYRMYSAEVLKRIPFQENTDEFHFDTQIIIQCRALGVDIFEVPIKTYYGDEECNVDGFKYAKDVILTVIEYRLHQLHFLRTGKYFVKRELVYKRKRSPHSSHEKILSYLPDGRGKKILEFGGGNGNLYKDMVAKDYRVICVDKKKTEFSKVLEKDFIYNDNIHINDLGLSREYDHIILSDNLAQTFSDEGFLKGIQKYIKEDGTAIIVVPNIANWFYRLSLLLGRFNYGDRGILDRKNLHFYTRDSILNLLERSGYQIEEIDYTGLPFEMVFETVGKSALMKLVDSCYFKLASLWPSLFAYQFILQAKICHLNYVEGEGKLV